MYLASTDDEITGVARYLDQQLDAIRASVIGLTEELARARPCASSLSVGGLLQHVIYGMVGVIDRLADPTGVPTFDEAAFARYQLSFTVGDDATVAGTLAEFDRVRPAYLAAVAAADPDAEWVEPPAPWNGVFEPRTARVRFYLVHQVEELARHAGHADIIREQLDGVAIPAIVLSQEGMAASSFFTPYVAAPGTIGS